LEIGKSKELVRYGLAFLLVFPVLCPTIVAQPEEGTSNLRSPDLVELVSLDSTIMLDIRYATAQNFLSRKVYSSARAFLQRPAAEALVRVHRKLRMSGFGLLVFDGYRPWSVTKLFWDETPSEKRGFVANPAKGSRHNRGCAVDLSLFRVETGEHLEMPSAYDEFSERAHPSYPGGTETQRRMRDLLRSAMESEGFTVNDGEWWHFDYKDWECYRMMDVSFEEIGVLGKHR
jgi:D-alanyl-D-alanine dipeptidase